MEISNKLLAEAKKCKNEEEIKSLAKKEGIDLDSHDATKIYSYLNSKGELSEEELDFVNGGNYCSTSVEGNPKYHVGDYAYAYIKLRFYRIQILENLGMHGSMFPEYKYKIHLLTEGNDVECYESELHDKIEFVY